MPNLDKDAIKKFASTGCERQLRTGLHPDRAAYRSERDALGLPHRQIRTALARITRAGDEWGQQKIHELWEAFGESVRGADPRLVDAELIPRLVFAPSALADYLPTAEAGQFLVETEFDGGNPTFRRIHGLGDVRMDGQPVTLDFSALRPDVVQVMPVEASTRVLTAEGEIVAVGPQLGTVALGLRVIDVKLNSEPGPAYFAELAYYSLSLAAWLLDQQLQDQFVVVADPAIWPGRQTQSSLQAAMEAGITEPYDEFGFDLVTSTPRVFVAEVLRVLRVLVPQVLDTPFSELPWAVNPNCQGCENLGQKFKTNPGTRANDWDPRHCLPTAETEQRLSRLPYLSRGAVTVLERNQRSSVGDVAQMTPDDDVFDEHHRLRGQRNIVSNRARALTGEAVEPLTTDATTTAIPSSPTLRVYLSADFDPGSTITLAFGIGRSWLNPTRLSGDWQPRVHRVESKSFEHEWDALARLLDDIDNMLNEAAGIDATASMQIYVWDTVTIEHLTRVIGRHLGRIVGSDRWRRLMWLFPPEQLLQDPGQTASPTVSIASDAVRSLLRLGLAHTYTLLPVARAYHPEGHRYPEFRMPYQWEDPFTNQVPPERIHEVWSGDTDSTYLQLHNDLNQAVKVKLWAMEAVIERMTNDLRGRLPRRPPNITTLSTPRDPGGSLLIALLYLHAKLNAAIDAMEVSSNRALGVDEREAKYVAARLPTRLSGNDLAEALQELQLTPNPHLALFRIAPSGRELQASEGDFHWTIMPREQTPWLDWTLASLVHRLGDATLRPLTSGYGGTRKLSDVFGVTILRFDRERLLLAVEFAHYFDTDTDARNALIRTGHVQLDTDLVLDKTATDHFSARVKRAGVAIGNPPSASTERSVAEAIGIARNPRHSRPIPAEDFIWQADSTAHQRVDRDVEQIGALIRDRHPLLNPTQWDALEHALTHRLTVIWGPPGTGKTHTLRALLAGLFADPSAATRPRRVAVTASTYSAFDTVLQAALSDLIAHVPSLQVRRLSSESRSRPDWLPQGFHVPAGRNSPQLAEVAQLLTTGTDPVLVVGTAEQMQGAIKAATGGDAGGLFDVIIIDEAGQLDVAHAVLSIAGVAASGSVVVAGDPKQLAPIHRAGAPANLEDVVGSIYGYYTSRWNVSERKLLINYRSNKEIVELGRRAGYPPELEAAAPNRRITYSAAGATAAVLRRLPSWNEAVPFSPDLVDIADPAKPVVLVTHHDGVAGQWNRFESDNVAALVQWYAQTLGPTLDTPTSMVDGGGVDLEDFWARRIGVVTPHRAQRYLIIERLAQIFCGEGADERMRGWIAGAVDTVERFQGQERDIILASYAVGDPDTIAEEDEFLHDLHRFNVLATRPKAKLVVFGSRELIDHISSDLTVVTASEMLKDFADLYCNQSSAGVLQWSDRNHLVPRDVEIRWRE